MWRRLGRAAASGWTGNSVTPGRDRISVGLTIWLALLWVLLFGTPTWLTVLGGILVSLAVQWFFPLPHVSRHWHVRVVPVVVLMVRFSIDLVVAGLQVSRIVLTGERPHTAIIRVDLRSADPVHLTIVSAMTSLVPGTIVVKVDRLAGSLYLHVLDLDRQGGPEGVRAAALGQEERILLAIASDQELEDLALSGQGRGFRRRLARVHLLRPRVSRGGDHR